MTEKAGIVEHLGEGAVLLPELIARALLANDRAKLRMTLLQEALSHSENPASKPRNLSHELSAAGLDRPPFDTAVAGARALDQGRITVPGVKTLLAELGEDLAQMLAPLKAGRSAAAAPLGERLRSLSGPLTSLKDDIISKSLIAEITSAERGASDPVHRLVMDMHQAINRLAAETAVEKVADASVFGLGLEDKARIEAFMKGLNRTRALAFGHPGLGTTATRIGPTIVIQNDIGTTDAHVVLAHVNGLTVTMTYTDVHRARVKFFMNLFEARHVAWSKPEEEQAAGLSSGFILVTGTHTAADLAGLDSFLEFFGSRLVFMIDWNKGRKALRNFVSDNAAKEILRWAADNDCGHRGFLELGGAQVIFEAIQRLDPARVPYGTRLESVLGGRKTTELMKRALRIATDGLLSGRSTHLLKDQIQALLASEFDTFESAFFTAIVRHLGLTRMMLSLIESAFHGKKIAPRAERERIAAQAKRLEHKTDQLTREIRSLALRLADGAMQAGKVIEAAENASDILEEAAFLLSLLPEGEDAQTFGRFLPPLLETAKSSICELIRAAEASSHLSEGRQADVTDALQAIDAVERAEKAADDELRSAMAAFIGSIQESRLLFLAIEVARAVESFTDQLALSGLSLRDRLLTELGA